MEHAHPDIQSPLYHSPLLSLQSRCNPLPWFLSPKYPFLWHYWASCCCLYNLYIFCTHPFVDPLYPKQKAILPSFTSKVSLPIELGRQEMVSGVELTCCRGAGHAFLSSVKWNSSKEDVHLVATERVCVSSLLNLSLHNQGLISTSEHTVCWKYLLEDLCHTCLQGASFFPTKGLCVLYCRGSFSHCIVEARFIEWIASVSSTLGCWGNQMWDRL